MNPSGSVLRAAQAPVAAVLTAAFLVGCGDGSGGAGVQGAANNLGPASPVVPGTGGTTGLLAVAVSGAVPTSGNAAVTGSAGTATLQAGTLRLLVAEGSGGGLQHRFSVSYDGVTGLVFSVLHTWGATIAAPDASVGCIRATGTATTVAAPSLCAGAVAVDVIGGRVTFTNAVLRNGTFTSILNGQVPYTVF